MRSGARSIYLLAAGLFCVTLAGCDQKPGDDAHSSSAGSGKPQVLTVNYPLAYFAERIGGSAVDVRFPAPQEGDPAFWQPDEDAIALFQSADLILKNGADYSKWMQTTSLPESIIVETSAAFAENFIAIHGGSTHSHGSDGEHSHDGVAFTTWIDLGQAIQQAAAIREALTRLLPERADEFESNFSSLRTDLETLDGDLAFAAQGLSGRPLVASHPVYQYLARRYGLRIRSVLWEPETVPDSAAMQDLEAILAKHPASVMIWEGDPSPESVEKLEAIQVKSLVFDPCGNRPGEGKDFVTVMRSNIEALSKAQATSE